MEIGIIYRTNVSNSSVLKIYFFDQFSKECIFNKTSANTELRVFYNGAFRIYNCNWCCKRWYFTFNGTECSAPAAIDGVVYISSGKSPVENLHRVRHIEGVCETVPEGIVVVGFSVGAYTGWNSVSRIYVEELPPPQAQNLTAFDVWVFY